MPKKKLRAALIGLGGIAWKYDAANPVATFALTQAGAILRRPDIELCGGYAPDAADRDGFHAWSGAPAFSDLEQLFHSTRPDLVGICSPTQTHVEQVEQCLKAGVAGIWLEKPPAERSGDIIRLATLAENYSASVCVNYFRRYLPVYAWLKKTPMELGRCRLIQLLYSPGLERNGSHFLDLLFFLTDAARYELLWVESGGDAANPAFTLRLDTGQLVSACGAALPYHSNTIALVCEGGVATVAHGGEEIRFDVRVENDLFPGFYTLRNASERISACAGLHGYMESSLQDLVDAMRNGTSCRSSLQTSLISQKLLEEILQRAEA